MKLKLHLSQDMQYVLVFFISASLISATLVWVSLTPRSQEQFFALGILGSNKMAEHYYPNDNPNLTVGSTIQWYLYLYNHMGSVQYVAIKVKLQNSTIPPPNSTACTPSSQPAFFEIYRAITDNETCEIPFTWSLRKLVMQGDSVIITELVVNNHIITGLNVSASSGFNYRIVIELWTYDENTQQFEFGWQSGKERYCAWNQIWFNATSV